MNDQTTSESAVYLNSFNNGKLWSAESKDNRRNNTKETALYLMFTVPAPDIQIEVLTKTLRYIHNLTVWTSLRVNLHQVPGYVEVKGNKDTHNLAQQAIEEGRQAPSMDLLKIVTLYKAKEFIDKQI